MRGRRSKLFYLSLSVFIPLTGIMLMSASDLVYSQKNLEILARSYVENYTEMMISRMSKVENMAAFDRVYKQYEGYYQDGKSGLQPYMGFGRLPALVMVLGKDGSFLYGSERLKDLMLTNRLDFPLGIGTELYNRRHERFTVCALAMPQTDYIVAGAIAWSDLPGITLRSLYLWPMLIAAAALWSILALWRLWRKVVIPLGQLESEISVLKWGEEIPAKDSPSAVYELQRLRSAFARVAQDAINRVSIIRTCMNDLVSLQEAERTKISRDIHDGPLQEVTALIQRIRLARAKDNTQEDVERELGLAEEIARGTVKEMRGLCDFLNPPWLDLGLKQALTELTERQSEHYGVKIFLDVDEDYEFTEAQTLAFFRVVQEAVTNSVKHGGARNIWVDVRTDANGIELCVQDDGIGFDMQARDTTELRLEGHRGLSNMEERMALVGGKLKVISYPGEGTCIRGTIP